MILRSLILLLAIGSSAAGLWLPNLALALLGALLAAAAFVGGDWPAHAACLSRRFVREWRAIDRAGIAGLLFIGALLLTLVILVLTWRDTYSRTAIVLWFAMLVMLVIGAAHLDSHSGRSVWARLRGLGSPAVRPELLTVAAITLVALVLRAYDLEAYPPQFHGDEGELGLLGVRLMRGERFPFFSTSGFAGLPFFFNYLQAGSMYIFGQSVFGVRILSAITGAACVPVVYAIARVAWGPVAAAVAAWLLAVSHLNIQYSRMALSNIEATLATATMILLLGIAWEAGACKRPPVATADDTHAEPLTRPSPMGRPGVWLPLVLIGVCIGLAQYVYVAARIMPIVAAPLLLVLWRSRRTTLIQTASVGFAALLVLAPLGAHYVNRPEQFAGRVETVSIFRQEAVQGIVGPGATLPGALPALLGEQYRRVLGLFVKDGDAGGFYYRNVAGFDVVTAALMWIGMGAALARFRRFHELSLLTWFWLGITFGGVFTLDQPAAQRLLLMVPAVYLFGGLAVERGWQLLQKISGPRLTWAAVPVGTSAALLLLSTNVTTYFVDFAKETVGVHATASAREIAKDSSQYRAYLLTGPVFFENHGAIKFIDLDVPVTMLRTDADFRTPPQDGKGVLIVALENRLQELRTIEARIPGGEESRFLNPTGKLIYIAYRVPPAPR